MNSLPVALTQSQLNDAVPAIRAQSGHSQDTVRTQSGLVFSHQKKKVSSSTNIHDINKEISIFLGDTICVGKTQS